MRSLVVTGLTIALLVSQIFSAYATTKGLSQIVTPDLEDEGDLSMSLQIQDKRIANPYELQAELGITSWAEVSVFRGFQPDDWILATELGILTKEPYLLSVGFINWSPHLNVDPRHTSKPDITLNTTSSSSAPFTRATKTKASLATLTTSTKPGAHRSISRPARKIHGHSALPATSRAIFNSIPRFISAMTTRDGSSVTSSLPTHFTFGATKRKRTTAKRLA